MIDEQKGRLKAVTIRGASAYSESETAQNLMPDIR